MVLKTNRKFLSIVLAVLLVIGCVPFASSAANVDLVKDYSTLGAPTTPTDLVIVENDVETYEKTLTVNSGTGTGETATFVAQVLDGAKEVTDAQATWAQTLGEDVATFTVNGNTIEITAVSAGVSTFTAAYDEMIKTLVITVTDNYIPVNSISSNDITIEMTDKLTEQINVTFNPAEPSNKTLTYEIVSGAEFIDVSSTGLVTAKAAGEAIVKINAADGASTIISVKVTDSRVVLATAVLVTPDPMELDLKGKSTDKINVEVTAPENGIIESITYSSSDTGIATVSDTGLVTAVAEGTTTIEVVVNGNIKETITVEVKETTTTNPVKSFEVTPDRVELDLAGKTSETLEIEVTPADADNADAYFTSMDTSIATVDENGVITAVSEGSTTVTVTVGGISKTVEVIVSDTREIPVTDIILNADNLELDLYGKTTGKIDAIVVPSNATDKTVTFEIKDTSIATVDANGNVTAVSEGSTTVTVKAGDIEKTVTVTVKDSTPASVPTAITVNPESMVLDLNGTKTGTITAEVTMSDGSKYTGTVEFTVADDKIATVDANGNVTAVAVGETTITVKAGDKSTTVKVTVVDKKTTDKKVAIRLYGNSRVETAVAISVEGRASADVVFLSTAKNFADALAGGPLAHAMNGPILLTNNAETLEADVLATITKLGAKEVVYLGGENAVRNYDSVLLAISSVEKTSRVSGQSRYTTAIAIADKLAAVTGKQATQVFLASGTNFPDALAISPVAAITGSPIVFTYGNEHKTLGKTLDSDTAAYLAKTNPATRVTVGGTAAVSAESHTQAGATDRVYGTSRFLTAVEIYNKYASVFTAETKGVALATGMSFPDALVGGVIAAREGMPLLLVLNTNPTSDASYATVCSTIAKINADKIYLFGGSAAIADATLNAYVANISTFDTTRAYMG